MKLSNLQAAPDQFLNTISLIESSFGYEKGNSFSVDFYPLVQPANRQNCWILYEDNSHSNKVVAHTGVLKREFELGGKRYPVLFVGGVAVDPKHRGQGLSKRLLQHIFSTYPQQAMYILWSEKVEMYNKYGFEACVELHEHPKVLGNSSFKELSFSELTKDKLNAIQSLYQNSLELRPSRSHEDWETIIKVRSSKLFIKEKDGEVINYFFMNKGQDLQGVIHEYGNLQDFEEISTHGRLWSSNPTGNSTALYACLAKIGDQGLFTDFIYELSGILIQEISQHISFEFQGQSHSLPSKEFMLGLFGPGRFQELAAVKKLFIPGLDSI